MNNPSRRTMPLILSIVLVVSAVIYLTAMRTPLTDSIAAVTALVGALAIWFQMKRSKDMEEGTFIVGLNDSFLGNEGIRDIYRKLVSGIALQEEDRVNIVEYLTFFETICVLYRRGLVDMAVLDNLFSYRFFLVVNSPDVQRMELLPDAAYYKNLYTLDYLWTEYRRKHGKEVDEARSLAAHKPDYRSYVEV